MLGPRRSSPLFFHLLLVVVIRMCEGWMMKGRMSGEVLSDLVQEGWEK